MIFFTPCIRIVVRFPVSEFEDAIASDATVVVNLYDDLLRCGGSKHKGHLCVHPVGIPSSVLAEDSANVHWLKRSKGSGALEVRHCRCGLLDKYAANDTHFRAVGYLFVLLDVLLKRSKAVLIGNS
jgi:hypothetical protein